MNHVKTSHRLSQWIVFLATIGFLGAFSFNVLPSLARLKPVEERMRLNDAMQIDGGATFYTELEFLEKLLAEREASTGK